MPRWLGPVVAALLIGASCGEREPGRRGDDPGSGSSPFAVGPAPAGYELITAGTGTQLQSWGSDSTGTDQPFTVLAPEGHDAASPEAVVVSVTGFEGFQGGLDQASPGYTSEEAEHFRVDGTEAIFTPAGEENGQARWADLVAVRGDDLAVRVTTPEAARDELVEVLRAVEPAADHRHAPEVPAPLGSRSVVGSVDADVLVALEPEVIEHTDAVPGTEVAHGAGWVRRGDPLASPTRLPDSLAVITLPGRAVDLDALAGYGPFTPSYYTSWNFDVRSREIGGRPGAVFDLATTEPGYSYRQLAVLMETPWGDVVMVVATGDAVPSEDELVAMAASVREASAAEWERFVVEATGGPGLNPDAGAVELARGRAGDLEWLFQARNVDLGSEAVVPLGEIPPEADGAFEADPCLKLSNRRRACAYGGTSSGWESVLSTPETVAGEGEDFDFPAFTVITTRTAGAQVRVHTGDGSATGAMYPIPGTDRYGALVFVDTSGIVGCTDPPPDLDAEVVRIEALDTAGTPVGCVSPGGI